MKIYFCDLQSEAVDQMSTELRYVIATARAAGDELIAINRKDQRTAKGDLALRKLLNSLKREGKIDFYADRESFENNSREASYLMNKFLDIAQLIESERFLLLIKL